MAHGIHNVIDQIIFTCLLVTKKRNYYVFSFNYCAQLDHGQQYMRTECTHAAIYKFLLITILYDV